MINLPKRIIAVTLICLSLFLFSCAGENEGKVQSLEIKESTLEPNEAIINTLKEVTFIACGDNITYGGNIKDARSKATEETGEFDFKPQYAEVAEIIKDADVAFINQEVPMAGEGYSISYYPMFNAPQELGLDLVELGFDVINVASNHMLDKGASGLESTIDFWESLDVTMIGGYKDEDDFDNIRVHEANGIKIAFLSYTYSTNGITKSPSSPLVIPYIDDEDIIRQVALARECADMVFVSMHWGNEYQFTPSAEQKRLAQLMADNGVDAVIGHHPHVLQPIEWYDGKDGNKMLCVFSLGNFVAEQDHDYSMVGGIAEIKIEKDGEKEAVITDVLFHPTVFHFPRNFYTNIVYFMEDYTPELASIHGVRNYYGNPLTYERLISYAKKTISDEFLTPSFIEKFKDY